MLTYVQITYMNLYVADISFNYTMFCYVMLNHNWL